MNRTEFTLATAVILFAAFALGWFAHWLLHRFARVAGSNMGELDRMAQELHDAEEARDETAAYAQTREAELMSLLAQSEAEHRATMEGLREARYEADELRRHVERGRKP